MEQVIFAGTADLSDYNSNTEYNALQGAGTWNSTEANRAQMVAAPGVIKSLYIQIDTAAGVGEALYFTLYLNGSPTALTCTIGAGNTTANDTTHEVDVVAGDLVSIQCYPAILAPGRMVSWSTVFESANANESLILAGNGNTLSNSATEYCSVHAASYAAWATAEANFPQVVATAGTIKDLYVELSAVPDTGDSGGYIFTVRKNGEDQALTVTITGDDTTGSDTEHSFTVSAGDYLTISCTLHETPAATPRARWGVCFEADTNGESLVLSGSTVALDASTTEYNYLQCCRNGSWDSTEANRYQLGNECTLKKFYVLLNDSPGEGKSYTFNIRNGDAGTDLTVIIADTDTSGNDTAHTESVSAGDTLTIECAPSGTPTARDAYWGLVCYIEPTGGPVRRIFITHQ
jgi:hypothetical protein